MIIIPIILLVIFLAIQDAKRKKASLKPVQFLNFNRIHFDRDFDFKCEFCGETNSTKNKNCANCGGTYDNNKEYKQKKKEINLKYIEFLKQQESLIAQEEIYIEKTLKALKKNWVMKNSFYNFELGEKLHYLPVFSFDFTCEYCGTKLKGNSAGNQNCIGCGAKYNDNTDLLVMEQEEHLRKAHYDEYQKLKAFEWNQNIENAIKDTHMNQNATKIALGILGGILLIGVVFWIIVFVFCPELFLHT